MALTPERKTQLKQQWYNENAPLGRELGYPECCIKEFCDQPPEILKHQKASKDDMRRYKAGCINGQFTGFVPCAAHAKEITTGRITLQSLIKDRSILFRRFPEQFA